MLSTRAMMKAVAESNWNPNLYAKRADVRLREKARKRKLGEEISVAENSVHDWSEYSERCIEIRFVDAAIKSTSSLSDDRLTNAVVKTVFLFHHKHSGSYTNDVKASAHGHTNPLTQAMSNAIFKRPDHVVYTSVCPTTTFMSIPLNIAHYVSTLSTDVSNQGKRSALRNAL